MALVSKPYSFTAGTTINDNEVDDNFDTLYTLVNGNLNEANLSGSIQIPNSALAIIDPEYVDAHADTAAEFLTATTPGTTGGLLGGSSLPNKLADELERIRYRFLANNNLVNTYFTDSSGVAQTAGWVEPQFTGPQLFTNNGFEVKTSATAGDAPDGWTLEGTPTSLVITDPGLATPLAGKEKKALRVTYRATANEGFKQTLTGLKASTKYLIGCTYARVSGSPEIMIVTTGGFGPGDYQNSNVSITPSGTAIGHFQAIVATATTGADVVVKFINAPAAADVVDFYQVWAYEMKDSTNIGLPHIPMQTATSSTESDILSGASATWTTVSALTLSQYIPYSGYRLVYECNLTYAAKTEGTMPETCDSGARIQMDVAGGGYNTVQGPFTRRLVMDASGNSIRHSAHHDYMKHVVENPVAGSTYTFHAELGVYDDGGNAADLVVNPDFSSSGMGQSVSFARLYLERL